MFRTIVVGCDGSDRAADAVALALQLRHPEGRLLLAAVHDHFGWPDRGAGYGFSQFMREKAEADLDAAAGAVPDDVPVSRHVLAEDSPAAALDQLATEEGADLIVLGSTHRGRLGKLTGRTTVQRLVHGAPCAVGVAAPGQVERSGKAPSVCVAYDGSAEAGLAVAAAFDIAATRRGTVTLMRVVEPVVYPAEYASMAEEQVQLEQHLSRTAEETLRDAVGRAPDGLVVESRLLYGPAAASVLDAAADGFDLLVVGSRRYGPMKRVLAGSVSTHALTDGRVPVLVTPRAEGPATRSTKPDAEVITPSA